MSIRARWQDRVYGGGAVDFVTATPALVQSSTASAPVVNVFPVSASHPVSEPVPRPSFAVPLVRHTSPLGALNDHSQ